MRQTIINMYMGLSKTEAIAVANANNHTVGFFWQTSHQIPQCLCLKYGKCPIDLYFNKNTRRIEEVHVMGVM